MRRSRSLTIVSACIVAVMCLGSARGEIKTIVEHIDNASATADFKLKQVPPVSKDDAASKAKFSIVTGAPDPNSGELSELNDGQLPREADDPPKNFFFEEGTDGGRILVDLNSAIAVKQVNVYSWHPNTRGPQVFKLYASDGAAAGFDSAPKRNVDPEKAGWKLIASVDTRPKKPDGAAVDDEAMGGQYGVSISDSAGPIGDYRYLLFVTARTEDHDDWGNTFYSEIDVIDNAAAATRPAAASELPRIEGKVFAIDVSATPDLHDWAADTLLPVCEKWYPIISQMLPSDGFVPPAHVTIRFRDDMSKGTPAMTSGNSISCNSAWFRRNLKGEAIGAVVHEIVHVVQQYGHPRVGELGRNPGWLVEGIADYIRWFKYEPQTHGADIRNPSNAKFDGSYRVTGNFLDWVTRNRDEKIVPELNAAMREGKYNDGLWKQYTGKTAQELGDEWKQSLMKAHESVNPAN